MKGFAGNFVKKETLEEPRSMISAFAGSTREGNLGLASRRPVFGF